MLPTHFPIFPCSPATILNLEPRVRTYYPTFYSFIIISEVSTSRLKTLECAEVSITQQKAMEDLPPVAGTRRRDGEMGFEASVCEEEAYVRFLQVICFIL